MFKIQNEYPLPLLVGGGGIEGGGGCFEF